MFGNLRLGYIVLLAIAAFGFALGATVGVASMASILGLGGLWRMLSAWVLLPLLWFGYVAVEITRRRIDRPTAAMRKLTFRHRHWLLRGFLFVAMIFPLARAVTSYKTGIPQLVPYFADPYFADADRLLFGTDPWRITHAVFGPLATMVIDRIYALWFPVMLLLMGWLCFTRNQKLQLRGLLTYSLSWTLLGNLAATAMASVGPCFYAEFYHSDRFKPLMETLYANDRSHPLFAMRAMRYLMDSFGLDRLVNGISAMPSLHVTIAFLCFLVALESTRQLWIKLLAFAFAMTILVGSVHLGWHYAVDGLAGIAGVSLIWLLAGRFVDWVEARQTGTASASPLGVERGTGVA